MQTNENSKRAKLAKLLELGLKNKDKIKNDFAKWYYDRKFTRKDIPDGISWIIEKYESNDQKQKEAHIHFFDYGMEGIRKSLEKYCKKNNITLDVQTEYPWHYTLRKEKEYILTIHDTTCSTTNNCFVCVHLPVGNSKSLDVLLALFNRNINEKEIDFYTGQLKR